MSEALDPHAKEPPGRCYPPAVLLRSLLATALASSSALSGEQAKADPKSSNLADDEELRLFPALAYPHAQGWEVHIRAWVYEPELHSWWRAIALRGLRRALGLPRGSESSTIFLARAQPFLADNERGKRVVLEIAGERYALPPTAANGHRQAPIRVPREALTAPMTPARAILRPGDPRSFVGSVLRLDPGGVCVISDIDDTVKISEVRDLEALLANTFLRPFAPVPGIATAYRGWAEQGAAFHYVSASPWHLYDPLRQFFADADLPLGSFHLKDFRWVDRSFLSLFQDPRDYKLRAIEPLLDAAPGRSVVLVGDSGEADPEAYAELYRRHPAQVLHIFIRDVSGETPEAARYLRAFDGVPPARWTIFRDAATLPRSLPAAPTTTGSAAERPK